MDANAPILLFDSGVGGLSVLAPVRALLPNAPIVYAADNAGFPYGTKSEAELAERVPALLQRLVGRFRPRLVVIACNTASTIALDHARAALEIPVVGTVPAIKSAGEQSLSRVIGVLGTEATVRQPYVDDLARRFASDCTIVRHGSPELVALAEAKLGGFVVDPEAVASAVAPLAKGAENMDAMVLACTHFPLLAEEIARACPGVRLIDGAAGIARRIAFLTEDQPWPNETRSGIVVFTAPPPGALIRSLAAYGLSEVRTIEEDAS